MVSRFWTVAAAIFALAVTASPAQAAATVTITINGVGAVSGSVDTSGLRVNCVRNAAGTYSGNCTFVIPNSSPCGGRICPEPAEPGTAFLSAIETDKGQGFVRWEGDCTGTKPECALTAPPRINVAYALTATFGDNVAPTVALTAPGGGFVRGAVTLAATAADGLGVAKVDFALAGATQSVASAPYAATFDSARLPDGPTTATAVATDFTGNASAPASAAVTVDNTAPGLDVTGPSNRTFAPGSTQVWILAATDATAGVAGLQCSLVGAGESPSFRACSGSATVEVADNKAPGAYRFVARATDNAGNATEVTRDFTVAATLQAAVEANGGRLPGSDGTSALTVMPVSLAYDFAANRRGTRFSALTLKRIPSGAKVSVSCTKGCPRKSFRATKPKSTLRIKPFLNRRLKPGAVLTVTVSKPGAITVIKRLTIRRAQRPRLESLCQAPGTKRAQRC